MPTVSELLSQNIGNTIMNVQTWNGVVYNVLAFGAKGDGITDDSGKIADAIAKASVNGGVLLFPPGTYVIGTNLTFPSNITAEFSNGAKLSINAGITVTFNGPINAGLYQIFSGSGTVSGNIKVHFVVPEWWGAKGDGISDDTVKIQSALNVSENVRLSKGSYLISNPLILDGQNLIGEGLLHTNLILNNVTSDLLQIKNVRGKETIISDLTLTSNVTKTSGSFIYFTPPFGLAKLENISLSYAYDGITIPSNASEIFISNVDIRNTIRSGIRIGENGEVNDIYISNVIVDNPSASQAEHGLYLTAPSTGLGANGIWVKDCDFLNCKRGIKVESPSGGNIEWLFFSNVACDKSSVNGWEFTGLGVIRGVILNGCWGSSSGNNGLEVFTCDGLVIDSSQFLNNYNNGIIMEPSGPNGNGAKNYTIKNCLVSGNNLGPNNQFGITIASGPAIVDGNIIGQMMGFGNTQNYGLYITLSSNIKIVNNTFLNNINGPISLGSGLSNVNILNNSGYNPVGLLSAPTIPASGTALTNPYYVQVRVFISGGTVSGIAINGTSTGLTSGEFLLNPGDSITLTYTAAPTWVWLGL